MALKVVSQKDYEEKYIGNYYDVDLEYWTEDGLLTNTSGEYMHDYTNRLVSLIRRCGFEKHYRDEMFIIDTISYTAYDIHRCQGRLRDRYKLEN